MCLDLACNALETGGSSDIYLFDGLAKPHHVLIVFLHQWAVVETQPRALEIGRQAARTCLGA